MFRTLLRNYSRLFWPIYSFKDTIALVLLRSRRIDLKVIVIVRYQAEYPKPPGKHKEVQKSSSESAIWDNFVVNINLKRYSSLSPLPSGLIIHESNRSEFSIYIPWD